MTTNDGCDGYGWLLWFVAEGEVAAGASRGSRGARCIVHYTAGVEIVSRSTGDINIIRQQTIINRDIRRSPNVSLNSWPAQPPILTSEWCYLLRAEESDRCLDNNKTQGIYFHVMLI